MSGFSCGIGVNCVASRIIQKYAGGSSTAGNVRSCSEIIDRVGNDDIFATGSGVCEVRFR